MKRELVVITSIMKRRRTSQRGLINLLVLISVLAPTFGFGQTITSIQRKIYSSPLIDPLLPNQFPRGGSYTATIYGTGLDKVASFTSSDPNVTGIVSSAFAAQVTVQISSTIVAEDNTAAAPILGVSFILNQTQTSGQPARPPISSGSVTIDIVPGAAPLVTSWKLGTPAVKWIPGGATSTITYLADVTTSGNIRFYYVECQALCDKINIKSWTSTGDQFTTHWTVVVDVATPNDFTFLEFPYQYGALDGAGQGGINGNDPLSPSKPINVPVVQMQLVDPVTGDHSTTLVDQASGQVVSDLAKLSDASYGTVVKGVAADGTAQLVVRVAGAPPDETLSLNVSPDGGLTDPGVGGNAQLTLDVTAGAGGTAAFLYKAPDDFAQTGSTASPAAASRIVDIKFKSKSSDNPGIEGDTQVTVVRPPLMLIHGFWGHPSNWIPFLANATSIMGSSVTNSWNEIVGDTNLTGTLIATQPSLTAQTLRAARSQADISSLGILFNARNAFPQIVGNINEFKSTNKVAAVQTDVIAHSMGGLVTRALPQVDGYQSSNNFNAGLVHKLITIDTPHLGTPLADALLSTGGELGDNSCAREYQAAKGKLAARTVTMVGQPIINGAAGEMIGDGFGNGLSAEVASLRAGIPTIPTAYVAGNGCRFGFGGPDNCPYSTTQGDFIADATFLAICHGSLPPLYARLPNETWANMFGQDSDAIVPIGSQVNQVNDLAASVTPPPFTYPVVHSLGANYLGFTAPNVFYDRDVAAGVVQLLDMPRSTPPYMLLY